MRHAEIATGGCLAIQNAESTACPDCTRAHTLQPALCARRETYWPFRFILVVHLLPHLEQSVLGPASMQSGKINPPHLLHLLHMLLRNLRCRTPIHLMSIMSGASCALRLALAYLPLNMGKFADSSTTSAIEVTMHHRVIIQARPGNA